MKYLSPKLDVVFKTMFGNKNNADMLRDLVKTYLGVDATGKFELTNTEITPIELEKKFARLDLKISTKDEEIDVEVQVAKQEDYSDRSLYYWAALYAGTVDRGKDYVSSKTTLSLNILDFKMFECDDYNTNFTFYDPKNGLTLSDKARISFISRGIEMMVMQIGVPLACVGLLDNDKGVFKAYINRFVKAFVTTIVQILLCKIGITLMLGATIATNSNIIGGIGCMIAAIPIPKVLREFLVPTSEGKVGNSILGGRVCCE